MAEKNDFIYHNRVLPHQKDVEAASRVIVSGQWASGSEASQLEEEIAAYIGYKYCVVVASGSAALKLALLAIGAGSGDEIIVPAYSCVCLANAPLSVGAIPIPVDIASSTWNIDPCAVAKLISKNTKAIIAVDTFGRKADIKNLLKLGLPVIRDCSHGFMEDAGLSPKYADITISSMYATKFLGVGEGGFIATNDRNIYLKLIDLRDYTDKAPGPHCFNYKMTDIEAAIARSRLSSLPETVSWRQRLALEYYETMKAQLLDKYFTLPEIEKTRIWYRYTVVMPEDKLDQIIYRMRQSGIGCEKPIEKWHPPFERGHLEVTEFAFKRILSLPFHEGITKADVEFITSELAVWSRLDDK